MIKRGWCLILCLVSGLHFNESCRPIQNNKSASEEAKVKGILWQNCPKTTSFFGDAFQSILNRLAGLEKQIWQYVIDKNMGRKFLEHYLSCSKEPYHLTHEEFGTQINYEFLNLDSVPQLQALKNEFSENQCQEIERQFSLVNGDKCENDRECPINVTLNGYAKHATLGYFYSQFYGFFVCDRVNKRYFAQGFLDLYDVWDFNPSSHRKKSTEHRVAMARLFMTGEPFPIYLTGMPLWIQNVGGELDFSAQYMIQELGDADTYSDFGVDVNQVFRYVFEDKDERESICRYYKALETTPTNLGKSLQFICAQYRP